MACEEIEQYTIRQGDDTDFGGNHFLYDYFISDLDLENYTVKCEVKKANLEKDLTLEYDLTKQQYYVVIDFTSEETFKMPLGDNELVIVVYNTEGKQQSLKRVSFKVLKRGS